MGLNLSILLSESAKRHADRPALRAGRSVVSYRELDAATDRAAAAFQALGIARGSSVAVMLPNGVDFVTAYFGALKAGATVVPLNVMLRAGELRHCLEDSAAQLLITGGAAAGEAVATATELDVAHVYVTGDHVLGAHGTLSELLAGGARLAYADTAPGDIAVLLYTSGTTGRPKGARLTHSGMAWIAQTIATRLARMTPEDVMFASLPLSHIFGLNAVLNVTLLAGACALIEEHFDPDVALTLMADNGVSVFPGVPAMCIHLLAAHERRPTALPALRVALLGGQSVPTEARLAFERTFGCHTIESYGISEVSASVAATPTDAPAKPGSVGKPIWAVDVRVVDDAGAACAPGTRGEILVRSVGNMAGYHNLPEATEQALRDGWFYTGDIGYLDDDGDLFVVDRKKDLIIRGGYNVYPREVEDVLYQHPAVLEAAVIGVPHDVLGEEVAAAVRLRPGARATADELRAHTRQHLAAYKYPRIVAIVDTLPTSSTGKLLKRAIDIDDLMRRGLTV
jgi:acyl-CoA synthetase (AMP-forming)/AMP-acid ligase II